MVTCEVPHKIFARSVQPDKQTDKQSIYIEIRVKKQNIKRPADV